jgi:hypothetical protein
VPARDLAAAALSRGYSYHPRITAPNLPGLIVRTGADLRFKRVVDARDADPAFVLGRLIARYGDDTSLPVMGASTVLAIPLPDELPDLVLLSNGLGPLRRAGISVHGRQRLPLEGDFDRTFQLFVPIGYERDALYLFTPDLMAHLVDTLPGFDLELVDRWMFVAAPVKLRGDPDLDAIASAVAIVRERVAKRAARYRDERVAGRPGLPFGADGAAAAPRTVSPDEHAAGAARRIAEGGRRVTARASLPQRLITIGSTVLLLGAVAWFVLDELAPGLLPALP